MSANPYDRRRGPRDRGAMMASDFQDVMRPRELRSGPWESPITFRDLEAMVHSAMRRGQQQDAERHDEALQQARREAWDEGHEAGEEAGRERLLADIERQHGGRVRDVRQRARQVLDVLEQEPRKVSKSGLAAHLSEAMALLGRLAEAHHNGFVEPPF